MDRGAFWSGTILFAAVMLMLIGFFNALQGLAAIFSDDYFVATEDRLLAFDFTAWGIITLVWGVVLVMAGVALWSGKEWARWFALVVVSLNMIVQIGFFAAFPLWSLIVIGLSVLVIYTLAARWDQAQADLSGPA